MRSSKGILLASLIILATSLATATLAHAEEDVEVVPVDGIETQAPARESAKLEERQTSPVPQTSGIESLSDKANTLAVEKEVESTDAEADDQIAADTAKEVSQVRSEIKTLEHQIRMAKTAGERAEKRAALQGKNLERAKLLAKETNAKLSSSTKRQKIAEKKLAWLKTQTEKSEKRADELRGKNMMAQAEISDLAKKTKELERRQKKALAQIKSEKAKAKTLAKKRSQLAKNSGRTRKQATSEIL